MMDRQLQNYFVSNEMSTVESKFPPLRCKYAQIAIPWEENFKILWIMQ